MLFRSPSRVGNHPNRAVARRIGLVGADRLLDLCSARLTGNLVYPGHTLKAGALRIHAAGHEIGHHGWTHRQPAALSPAEEQELLRANLAIEAVTGQKARGYRSPAWNISATTLDLLITHGFSYDSSMMGHDYLPYFARRGDRRRCSTLLFLARRRICWKCRLVGVWMITPILSTGSHRPAFCPVQCRRRLCRTGSTISITWRKPRIGA